MAEVGIYKAACQVCAAALTLRYVKRRSRGRNVAGSRRGAHEPRQLPPCGAAGDGQPGTSGEGDELLNLLREDVERKRRAEAELTSYVEGEKQKLREAAEQAKDAIDQMRQESKEIASQQHDEAMGNIDQMSLQLERDVKESQRRRESDEDEFVEWERNMTQQRNEGQFFKNLYTSVLSDQKSPEQTQDAMEDMQGNGKAIGVCLCMG
ncbi:unnamed protein product [Ostreobium quekettii]|uniref:Uncharacterized protein n=1 Tax=Ostreobium quekettii TaxID=121088 RepID=A0A8S1JDC6_9CHLO|nr:unnamed protein product [Ostreobium quekettii]